jgi:hypothetical protein
MSQTKMQDHATYLLRFPRELRDMIYPDVVREASPVPLISPYLENGLSSTLFHIDHPYPKPHLITRADRSNPTVAAEALEAYWNSNTFIVDLDPALPELRTWVHSAIPRSQVHHLVISVNEEIHSGHPKSRADFLAFEHQHWNNHKRRRWSELLGFSNLKTLSINMHKQHPTEFCWMFLSPILYTLRTRQPGLQIKFQVSFDEMLIKEWNNEYWAQFNNQPLTGEYERAGLVDVSDTFGAATEGDRCYVNDYLPHRIMPTSRDAIRGLFEESPAQRRALGSLYFVSEPSLLRVLMDEHYEVYTECESERMQKN